MKCTIRSLLADIVGVIILFGLLWAGLNFIN